jgi:hypothetical protein
VCVGKGDRADRYREGQASCAVPVDWGRGRELSWLVLRLTLDDTISSVTTSAVKWGSYPRSAGALNPCLVGLTYRFDARIPRTVLNIRALDFEFVSDFVLRVSDLEARLLRPT